VVGWEGDNHSLIIDWRSLVLIISLLHYHPRLFFRLSDIWTHYLVILWISHANVGFVVEEQSKEKQSKNKSFISLFVQPATQRG